MEEEACECKSTRTKKKRYAIALRPEVGSELVRDLCIARICDGGGS